MILPTTDNLEVRGVHVNRICCVCREVAKSVFNSFLLVSLVEKYGTTFALGFGWEWKNG